MDTELNAHSTRVSMLTVSPGYQATEPSCSLHLLFGGVTAAKASSVETSASSRLRLEWLFGCSDVGQGDDHNKFTFKSKDCHHDALVIEATPLGMVWQWNPAVEKGLTYQQGTLYFIPGPTKGTCFCDCLQ